MTTRSDGPETWQKVGAGAAGQAPDLAAIGRQGDLPRAWLRAPIVLLIGWWTCSLAAAEQPTCFLDGIDLAFHEAGHIFLAPFRETIHVLGGALRPLPGAAPPGRSLPERGAPFPPPLPPLLPGP